MFPSLHFSPFFPPPQFLLCFSVQCRRVARIFRGEDKGGGGGGGCMWVVKMQTCSGVFRKIWIALDCISHVFMVDKERDRI